MLAPIDAYADELTAIRRDLHAHPEIDFEEVRPSGVAAKKLQGIKTHRGIGKTGVVGIASGEGGDGRRTDAPADHGQRGFRRYAACRAGRRLLGRPCGRRSGTIPSASSMTEFCPSAPAFWRALSRSAWRLDE